MFLSYFFFVFDIMLVKEDLLLVDIKGVCYFFLLGFVFEFFVNLFRYGIYIWQKEKLRRFFFGLKGVVESLNVDRMLFVLIDINIRIGVKVVMIIGFNIGGKIVVLKILGVVVLMVKVGLCLFVIGVL